MLRYYYAYGGLRRTSGPRDALGISPSTLHLWESDVFLACQIRTDSTALRRNISLGISRSGQINLIPPSPRQYFATPPQNLRSTLYLAGFAFSNGSNVAVEWLVGYLDAHLSVRLVGLDVGTHVGDQ